MHFDVVQAGRSLHYVLGGCHVTSYSISRSGTAPPMEEISFNYSSMSWSWGA
jgi:type VI protein secretion system component Hcp